jgi:uncharacterized cupin superfamily protein
MVQMKHISNLANIPKEFMDDPEFSSSLKTVRVGDAIGTEQFYVNVDCVKPGSLSTKYHAHDLQEEFFMIMAGSGILRFDGQEMRVSPGDVISKPAGKGLAHQFINDGHDILQIMDIGTRVTGDTIVYPDEGTVYVKGQNRTFHIEDSIQGWSSDPND